MSSYDSLVCVSCFSFRNVRMAKRSRVRRMHLVLRVPSLIPHSTSSRRIASISITSFAPCITWRLCGGTPVCGPPPRNGPKSLSRLRRRAPKSRAWTRRTGRTRIRDRSTDQWTSERISHGILAPKEAPAMNPFIGTGFANYSKNYYYYYYYYLQKLFAIIAKNG